MKYEIKEKTFFDILDENKKNKKVISSLKPLKSKNFSDILEYYNKLNDDITHRNSSDDICTPMECVKRMIDYIPNELWNRKNIKILDPCAGNGNFGAYCMLKTNIDNIWFYDINDTRIANCKRILNPKHIENCNFFDLLNNDENKFDMIMANPPYSGGGNKNQSISNEFIMKSIDLLKDRGYLCFIAPNNWMTYNNDNKTLKKLLNNGSFIVIDNDVKKYFNSVGSSFTVFVWQKSVFTNKTKVINGYLIHDIKENVIIPNNLKFIPLYLSNEIIDIEKKTIDNLENGFNYRCDLHNFTKKDLLNDEKNSEFKYETIHTARKTRYAKIKQDIYDKWIIVVPLSTYYIPYIKHNVNTTQSVGYFSFENKKDAESFIKKINEPYIKTMIHLTRYGNFNNIMVLKHLIINKKIYFTKNESDEINKITNLLKY